MKKIFLSVVGTRDWQCKHMSFDNLFDIEDYAVKVAPSKAKLVADYIDLADLCRIMSDNFTVWHYEWQK
jgi:hypothetical protein